MSSSHPFEAVLIVSFGGPQGQEEIRPFLQNVLRGRRVPPERVEQVAHHYELFGGVSPLTALTRRQAAALRGRLEARGLALPVYVGMRNWHPFLHDTLRTMRDDGVRHAVGVIAATHHSYSSCTQYRHNVLEARSAIASGWEPGQRSQAGSHSGSQSGNGADARREPNEALAAPDVIYADGWHLHAGFIAAAADRIEHARAALPAAHRGRARLVFTAHSIPMSMAHVDTYQRELRESAAAVAAKVGTDDWALVYQSRSGRPQDPWLEPDVNDYLRLARVQGVQAVVLSPIGFVCDHIEVLYDLDIEAKTTCEEVGMAMARAAAVNDHPRFVDAMSDAVAATIDRYRAGRPIPLISSESPNPLELPPPVMG